MRAGRIKPNEDPYDELTLQTGEVIRLATLLEEIANVEPNESTVSIDALIEGCGAVARVIIEKVQAIERYAKAIKGGAR